MRMRMRMRMKMKMGSGDELVAALSIIFSAGTYLFALFSNIAVTLKYYKYSSENPAYRWLFAAMVVLLVAAHTVNAFVFAFKFSWQEAPLKAAYFLPLIHFWRLLKLFWTTCTCQGVKDVTSKEMNTLFSILSTAMETGPLLTVQFIPINFINYTEVKRTAIVSIAASLLSAAYNGATAILWTAKNAVSTKAKIGTSVTAGSFTLFALILRCLTYYRISEVFEYSWSPPTIFCIGLIIIFWLLYLIILTPDTFQNDSVFNWKKCIRAFAFSHMSLTVGPLYPMVDEARAQHQLGQPVFRFKLLCVAIGSLLPDVIVTLAVVVARGLTMPTYLIAFCVAVLLYTVSILMYLMVDRHCGAIDSLGYITESLEDKKSFTKEVVKRLSLPYQMASSQEHGTCPSLKMDTHCGNFNRSISLP